MQEHAILARPGNQRTTKADAHDNRGAGLVLLKCFGSDSLAFGAEGWQVLIAKVFQDQEAIWGLDALSGEFVVHSPTQILFAWLDVVIRCPPSNAEPYPRQRTPSAVSTQLTVCIYPIAQSRATQRLSPELLGLSQQTKRTASPRLGL